MSKYPINQKPYSLVPNQYC